MITYKASALALALTYLFAANAPPLEGQTDSSVDDPTPRGLALLALQHEDFPERAAWEVLRHSPKPAVAFLFGQFGYELDKPEWIGRQMIDLRRGGEMTIYIHSGPTRRSPSRAKFLALGKGKSVKRFIREFANPEETALKRETREKALRPIRGMLERLRAASSAAGAPPIRIVLVGELEDNFGSTEHGRAGFAGLLRVCKDEMAGLDVEYRRNAVRGLGWPSLRKELHTYDLPDLDHLRRGDAVTGDGDLFLYPKEDIELDDDAFVTFKELDRYLSMASRRGIAAYVWRPEHQGLSVTGGNDPADTMKRKIRFPRIGSAQSKALIRLMRT